MHILIVEDRLVYIDRWSRFLQNCGHSVAVATTHTESFKELSTKRPDLIICDNDINPCPMYDDIFDGGFFFISKIRDKGFDGRIIFYTRGKLDYFTGELDIARLNVRYIQKQRKTSYTKNLRRGST